MGIDKERLLKDIKEVNKQGGLESQKMEINYSK